MLLDHQAIYYWTDVWTYIFKLWRHNCLASFKLYYWQKNHFDAAVFEDSAFNYHPGMKLHDRQPLMPEVEIRSARYIILCSSRDNMDRQNEKMNVTGNEQFHINLSLGNIFLRQVIHIQWQCFIAELLLFTKWRQNKLPSSGSLNK